MQSTKYEVPHYVIFILPLLPVPWSGHSVLRCP